MNEKEKLNNYMEDLYQAMQIGDITFTSKSSSELYNLINKVLEENRKYNEVINKATWYLNLFISDENLSKYDILKILMYVNKILKEVEHE